MPVIPATKDAEMVGLKGQGPTRATYWVEGQPGQLTKIVANVNKD